MALTTPILYSQAAFDAKQSHTFTFNVVGGNQVVGNRLVITKQSNNSIAYDNTITTYEFKHTVDSNVLQNGTYYRAVIYTIGFDGDTSSASSPIQFYCYTTPDFKFTNVPSTISDSTYKFTVNYKQSENEILNSYIFNLYNASKVRIATSDIKYTTASQKKSNIDLSYDFGGLQDNTEYFIQVTGVTAGNTQISTDMLSFNVRYIQPETFGLIELKNNCSEGYISIKSNLVAIKGQSIPSPPTYVDGNTAIKLTEEGEEVSWNEGYSIDGDFTATLWGRNFNENRDIITLTTSGDRERVIVGYRKNHDGTVYADLAVHNNQYGSITSPDFIYYICTDSVVAPQKTDGSDKMQIWFRRIGDLYELKLVNDTNGSNSVLGIGLLGSMVLGKNVVR